MEETHPPLRRRNERSSNSGQQACTMDEAEVRALVEENAQLRQVVINLSRLVLRRVAHRG
jgi:ribosomal protein S14